MSTKRRLAAIEEDLASMAGMLQRIEAALVVRDPGTARSAEAFDGLRKTVQAAMRERRAHLAHLVQLSDSLERGATVETIGALATEWCQQAGVQRWGDATRAEYFEIVEGDGPTLEVIRDAWVETSESGEPILLKQGQARRTHSDREASEEQT